VIDALKGAKASVSSQIRDEAPMAWIYLAAAILLEVAGITAMKLSRGFSEVLPSIAVPMFYVLSGAAVILALKRLELGVTYAVWLGGGHRARGHDRNRLFPGGADFDQGRSRPCDSLMWLACPLRHGALADSQQMPISVPWKVFSAKATA